MVEQMLPYVGVLVFAVGAALIVFAIARIDRLRCKTGRADKPAP